MTEAINHEICFHQLSFRLSLILGVKSTYPRISLFNAAPSDCISINLETRDKTMFWSVSFTQMPKNLRAQKRLDLVSLDNIPGVP